MSAIERLRAIARRAARTGSRGTATTVFDARLLQRTRVRLILWSGGSTLILLTVLCSLLYWAVAEKLRTQSIEQLNARATSLQEKAAMLSDAGGPRPPDPGASTNVTTDPAQPGLVFGGQTSGTLGVVFSAQVPSPKLQARGIDQLNVTAFPIGSSAAIAAAVDDGQTSIEETTIDDVPVRVLTTPVDAGQLHLIVQAIGDRTAEVHTLQALLIVLVVGGLAVVAGAVAVGYVYAGRALVPIRESLARQREFAADASHELRTPLAIVSAAVDHLRRHPTDTAAVERAAEDIEAGSLRLTGLVDDLLLLARADADAVEMARGPQDLGEIAADALAGFATLAEEHGVRLRLDIEPAPVFGDSGRLRQLVGILVDNAIRHTPEGGAVTIRVRPGASLWVEDDGSGIRPDDLPHVFRRFWRAPDAPAGGTGLGLAIADWIATSHGGRIRAGNRPTGGAVFTVGLPAVS
jgi:signal transduction histidine kinase